MDAEEKKRLLGLYKDLWLKQREVQVELRRLTEKNKKLRAGYSEVAEKLGMTGTDIRRAAGLVAATKERATTAKPRGKSTRKPRQTVPPMVGERVSGELEDDEEEVFELDTAELGDLDIPDTSDYWIDDDVLVVED